MILFTFKMYDNEVAKSLGEVINCINMLRSILGQLR